MKISVSFLKSKYDLNETINKIENTDADYIHVDVMDGIFVANTANSFKDIFDVLNNASKPLDVHLMVDNPIDYIMDFKRLNPKFITIHKEINRNIDDLIDLIHSYNIGVGLSIKPNTKVDEIIPYLKKVDNVLIMSVEPGRGGQKFMENVLSKVDELVKLRNGNNYGYYISIDGGINNETIELAKNVDIAISGSYICESDNYQSRINSLR